MKTVPNRQYVLTTSKAATLTCVVNGKTYTLVSATAAGQYSFVALGMEVQCDDTDAFISGPFDGVPAAALGGGGGAGAGSETGKNVLILSATEESIGSFETLKDGSYLLSSTPIKSCSISMTMLTNGSSMFKNCTALQKFTGNLPALTNGSSMFQGCTALQSATTELPMLTNGTSMFQGCTALQSITLSLPAFTQGSYMFEYCKTLKSAKVDMPALTDAYFLFSGSALKSFEGDLSSLKDGRHMFKECHSLMSFNGNIPVMTSGHHMFYNCKALTTFNMPLSIMYTGDSMFYGCISLTSFASELKALIVGTSMFSGCKLDLESVKNIADTINDLTGLTLTGNQGKITIGMAAELSGNEEVATALAAIRSKGWTITEQYNS